jgi:uncharacterized protein YyaL (SSP411 family)
MSATSGTRNRLAGETSPYLLLHAGNPVDWYPWGDEAFEKARREGKPIFLSIGYSTCYWCHVMERESFSDPEIARVLNEGFVSIKLDREERPDLDEIYMTATQLLTRQGGWPNSLFLTHERKPFFAGTYFPPEDRYGRPGFPRVLSALREAWQSRRAEVEEQAEALVAAIREQTAGSVAALEEEPGEDVVAATLAVLARRFDPEWGGFSSAPKFPSPANLEFLLDRAHEGESEARRMLVDTLDAMARGGIQDQIGGGFHRYSTDGQWLVPHFEKMLYDNAALAALYAEAATLAPEAGFARVARMTCDFVLGELISDQGAFLSAIDAETDGHEGAYYTWTKEELDSALEAESRRLLAAVYGFDHRPNFEGSRYVLYLPEPLAERARLLAVTESELLARIEPGRQALLLERARRKRPLVDDKILTDWNGLMIGALARAGRALAEPRYVETAIRAARFVLKHLVSETGRLLHAYRGGRAKIEALVDDYAFLVQGLLALHTATADPGWLSEARRIVDEQDDVLWDGTAGGYFASPDGPGLLVRSKSASDGAVASGNGIAALNLLALARLTGERSYSDRARALLRAFGTAIAEWPLAHVTLVQALGRLGGAGGRPVEIRGALLEAGPGPWLRFAVDLAIQPSWHVNAHEPGDSTLVPTRLEAASSPLRNVRYPAGAALDAAGPRVYTGDVRIEGEIESGVSASVRVTYQPCDAARCLLPVTLDIPLPLSTR